MLISIQKDKNQSNIPHGIMFHHFHRDDHFPEGQGSITAKEFDKIINYIGVSNIIDPEEWIYKQNRNRLKKKIFV